MIENKFLKWALILGIIVVLNLFFAYAMKVVYNEPEYTNFCEEKQIVEKIDTKEQCIGQGGQWNEKNYIQPSLIKKTSFLFLKKKEILKKRGFFFFFFPKNKKKKRVWKNKKKKGGEGKIFSFH